MRSLSLRQYIMIGIRHVMASWHKNLGVYSRRFIIKQIGDN